MILLFSSSQKKKLFNTQFKVFFELAITEIQLNNVTRFDREELAPIHSIFSKTIKSYDPLFWGNHGQRNTFPDSTEDYVDWVWKYWMTTGDRVQLAALYPVVRNITGYLARAIDPKTGLVTNLPGGGGDYLYGLVDWPPQMRYGYDMDTAARTTLNVMAVNVFRRVGGDGQRPRSAASRGRTVRGAGGSDSREAIADDSRAPTACSSTASMPTERRARTLRNRRTRSPWRSAWCRLLE